MDDRSRHDDPLGVVHAALAVVQEPGLDPVIQLAAAKAALAVVPWRIVGAVALVVVVAIAGQRVSTWRESHHALQATQKALAMRTAELTQCSDSLTVSALAYADAAGKAESIAAADRETRQRVENELQTNLAAADARGRDLARRLRDYQARRCSSAVPAVAGPAVELAGAAGEPGRDGAVEGAVADVMSACAADSVRLAGWQGWWREVSVNRTAARSSD